jgi:hypothetical protein
MTEPTHVFAKFLNLKLLSRASPSLVSAHRPPEWMSSGPNAAVSEASSEPLEKRGCDDMARMETVMGVRAAPVLARRDDMRAGRDMCDVAKVDDNVWSLEDDGSFRG